MFGLGGGRHGLCSAEGRHRRLALLQQAQGAGVDVCHGLCSALILLQQAQGAGVDACHGHCSAEGRHRRLVLLHQAQGDGVDVCHGLCSADGRHRRLALLQQAQGAEILHSEGGIWKPAFFNQHKLEERWG